jgi:hypothetical protein
MLRSDETGQVLHLVRHDQSHAIPSHGIALGNTRSIQQLFDALRMTLARSACMCDTDLARAFLSEHLQARDEDLTNLSALPARARRRPGRTRRTWALTPGLRCCLRPSKWSIISIQSSPCSKRKRSMRGTGCPAPFEAVSKMRRM